MNKESIAYKHVKRIISALGITQGELGAKMGLTKGGVSKWKEYKYIPSRHCYQLEQLLRKTSDKMTRIDLRPDDWMDKWPDLAKKVNKKKQANA